MHNKRQHPRFEEKNRVTVTVLQALEAPHLERRCFHCWTHDLSLSGLKFCVHSAVPIRALLKLEIAFTEPNVTFVHLARVVWEQEFEDNGIVSIWLGVKFTETVSNSTTGMLWADVVGTKLGLQSPSPDVAM
jgi:hypothetical protein